MQLILACLLALVAMSSGCATPGYQPQPQYRWKIRDGFSEERIVKDKTRCKMDAMKVLPVQQFDFYVLCMQNGGHVLEEIGGGS